MKLFKSFFMGGFECADLINNRGNRVNLLTATAHDQRADEDYRLLAEAGIRTVREGICWSEVEKTPYRHDFTEVKGRLAAAQKHGIQQLWDICHFGYPDNLMPSHPQFADRFAATCEAFAKLYRQYTDDPLIVTPINEISFLSWLSGDVRGTVPFAIRSGDGVKYFLCTAAIRGIQAIRSVDPAARILMVEPLIRIHPPVGSSREEAKKIIGYNEGQFEAVDMITGRLKPEMGGHPEYVDVVGFNYYYDNQWIHFGPRLPWKKHEQAKAGAMPFADLLLEAYKRYGKPVIISETGHFGEDRSAWMLQFTDACIEAMGKGVDLRGVCLYPILDRPDWDTPEKYIDCGVWGYDTHKNRFVHDEYLNTVKGCMAKIEQYIAGRVAEKQRVAAM